MSAIKRNALGKGLSALLEDNDSLVAERKESASSATIMQGVSGIPVDQVEANPYQPRTHFEEVALQELSDSIKVQGVIQPITVRRLAPNKFQLISGERRLKASKLAGLKDIPAYIRTANDQEMLEMALIENIQRENLNAIEVAISFQRMLDECSLKQEELGGRVGKNRSTVTNYLRLLKLPPAIQASIRDAKLSMGHARALISVEDVDVQLYIHNEILKNELSVRKVEEMVRNTNIKPISTAKPTTGIPFHYQKVEDNLSSKLSSKVQLKVDNKGKGQIVIPFLSNDDLNRILEMLDW